MRSFALSYCILFLWFVVFFRRAALLKEKQRGVDLGGSGGEVELKIVEGGETGLSIYERRANFS